MVSRNRHDHYLEILMTHIDLTFNPYYRLTEALKELDNRNKNLAVRLTVFGTYQDTENFRIDTAREHLKTKSHVDKILHDIKEIRFREDVESVQLRKLRKHFQSQVASHQQFTQKLSTKMKITVPVKSYQNSFSENNDKTTPSGTQKERQGLSGYGVVGSKEETQRLIDNLNIDEYSGEEEEIYELAQMMQDVNDVYEDLHEIINDQQSDIDDIEDQIQKTRDQVMAGNEEILKKHSKQRKARRRKCCFLIILLLAAGVIAVVLVISH